MRQLKNKLMGLIYEITTKGFVVGFVLGISITYLQTPVQILSLSNNTLAYENIITGLHPSSKSLAVNERDFLLNNTTNSSAKSRGERDRILCWVITSPKTHSRARLIKQTWGKRCNVLLFMSSIKGRL